MLFNEYKISIYDDKYINEKNILSLCFNKKINNNCISIIKLFLLKYKLGLAIYNIKDILNHPILLPKSNYIINIINHPILYILKILPKYNLIEKSENIFNKLLYDINNVSLNNLINLNNILDYLFDKKINLNYSIYYLLDYINKYITNINISLNSIELVYNKYNNKYYLNRSFCENVIELNDNKNNLYDLILNNYGKYNKIDDNIFIKKLLINDNDVIYFYIDRLISDKNELIIPKILDLPPFVFNNELNIKFKLITIFIYHDNIKQYSIIIEDNNN